MKERKKERKKEREKERKKYYYLSDYTNETFIYHQ
jgi:hypothetical protein